MKMLDLSKFEKVKEDKQTTTMRHKDGHEMTIMHAKLPKIHREQLKRLKMADGGDVSASDASDSSSSDQSQAPDKSITINVGTPAAQQPQNIPGTMAVSPANPAVSQAESTPYVNVPAVPKTPPNVNPVTGTMNPAAVSQNTQTASQLQGDINAAKAKGAQGIEQNYTANAAQAAQIDQQNLADVKGHVDQFAQYVQQHPIDPNHYMQSASTGQKIANAIGLLAGGFSGGFNGTGNNPAMSFINSQIDRDIQSQRDRMEQQKTVFGAYRQIYGDSVAANAATKASMLDIYNHQFNQLAAQLGTPQAQQAAMAFGAAAAAEKSKLLQDAAVNLRQLPGYSSGQSGHAGAPNVQRGQMSGRVGGGAQASWAPSGEPNPNDHILNANAAAKDAQLKYDHVHTEQQKSDIHNQYLNAVEADKAIDQINAIYPKLKGEATMAGYLANKVDPNAVAAVGAAGAEALGAAGAIPTAGASLVGAIPGAIAAGGAGRVIGSGVKQGLRAWGGQEETQYETDRAALRGYIGRALSGTQATPTEMDALADEFVPTRVDNPAAVENKRHQLIEKIKTFTNTGAIRDNAMTRKQYTLP